MVYYNANLQFSPDFTVLRKSTSNRYVKQCTSMQIQSEANQFEVKCILASVWLCLKTNIDHFIWQLIKATHSFDIPISRLFDKILNIFKVWNSLKLCDSTYLIEIYSILYTMMQMEQIFEYDAKYHCAKCRQQWSQQNSKPNRPTLCTKCGMPAYPFYEHLKSFFHVPRFRSISKMLTK